MAKHGTPFSRRLFLGAAGLCAAEAQAQEPRTPQKVAVFSKHLRFVEGEELAQAAASIGFDGIDLAVRAGGHVEPERVKQDLAPLVGLIRKHGLEVPMLTTDIVDAGTPFAEDILKAMTDLGIRYYRWGGMKYAGPLPLPAQLDEMKPRVAKLAALNSRYRACAMYHTHSGIDLVGASIWDLYLLLRDFDPNAVGVNFDVAHATIEGGLGGWIDSFRLIQPYLRGIAVKDFVWGQDAKGAWVVQWKPIGEGMVHLREFCGRAASAHFSGPFQMHFEYPLGGANSGSAKLTIPREEVYAAMKKDLAKVRVCLVGAGLA